MANVSSAVDGRAPSRALPARLRGGVRALWLGVLPLALVGCTAPTFVDEQPDDEVDESDDASAVTRERDAATALEEPDDVVQRDAGARAPSDSGTPEQLASDAVVSDSGVQTSRDAQTVAMTGSDAAQSASTLPEWALPLIGTYAKRSVAFSYDDDYKASGLPGPFNTQNVELSIVKIVRNGEQLDLESQVCYYGVSLREDPTPLVFRNAPKTPPLTGRIELGAQGSFRSTEMIQHLGFDPSPERSQCTGRRTKFPGQDWNSATCACYGTQVPVNLDDCRVIDGDADGKAGITARGPAALTSGLQDYLMVFDYSLKFTDGELKSDGQLTLREQRAQTPACINASLDLCSIGHNQLCPGGSTKLIKHTDSSPLTCATLNMGQFGPIDLGWPDPVDCRAK